jgi:GR25 family glycosyltransferase involved in LPS biosynthesis
MAEENLFEKGNPRKEDINGMSFEDLKACYLSHYKLAHRQTITENIIRVTLQGSKAPEDFKVLHALIDRMEAFENDNYPLPTIS